MSDIDYTKLLPEPPEDLIAWTLQGNPFPQEYLIYKAAWRYEPLEERNYPAVEVCCTACGRKFLANKVTACGCHAAHNPAPFGWWHPELSEAVVSGNDTICPYCGQAVETVHIGCIPHGISAYTYTTVVSRISVEGKRDRLVLCEWEISRNIEKDGREHFGKHLQSAWVVEERKIIRIAGYQPAFYRSVPIPPTQRKQFYDDYGEAGQVYPWDRTLLDGTTAENSKLDMYISQGCRRLVAYLALWRKRPAVENLVMAGMAQTIDKLISEEHSSYYNHRNTIPKLEGIDWKQAKPHLMLGMDKDYFRRIGRYMTASQLHQYRWAKANGVCSEPSPDELRLLAQTGCSEMLLDVAGVSDYFRAARYLERQKASVVTYRDYINVATTLDMDMTDSSVRYPKDLLASHDRVTKLYNERKSSITRKTFARRSKVLDKLSWSCDGILIRPAHSAAELKREGTTLHHCVASYADRHAMGETAIFFIRRESEPDTPWYTLELDERALTVRQNRGSRNCDRTDEVVAFEKKWLEWLREQRKKSTKKEIKKGAKAA